MTRGSRTERSESELASLRRLATDFASARKETPTTVHLLAAVVCRPGAGAELLLERGLDRDAILKATRSVVEDGPDAIGHCLAEAREVAKRARGQVSTDGGQRGKAHISPDSRLSHVEPAGLHVLCALLANRASAAHRALTLSGVDVTRLRAVALARASGAVPARRAEPRHRAAEAAIVPLLPPALRSAPAPASGRSEPPPPRSGVVASPPERAPSRALPPPVRRPVKRPAALSAPAASSRPAPAPAPARPRVVGRDAEVLRVLDVLGKHRANTPCLIGPSGVGKSSVARAVACRLEARGARVVEVSIPALVSGTAARGALSERLAALFDDARAAAGGAVLWIDDVHELVGAGEEAAMELKAQLARADVPVVCATSTEAFRRSIEPDAQLFRRLVPVEIEEPSEADAVAMVRAAADVLSAHHRVRYADDVVRSSVAWSVRYMPGRALPDKAIGALDLAGARVRRVADEARKGRDEDVGQDAVAGVIAELCDVPVERLLQNDRERLLGLEAHLAKRVVGHAAEIRRIAAQLRKSAAGLRQARPLGSFLLLGPTGVGKTETAKAVAEALFGSDDAMTRIDLSEFAESHALARLVGAPPGYVGHEAGGQITEAVRRRPYQVVLLDEIEKAHPEVLLAFLQVLDEGRLTDGRGRRVDFTNVVVVMTSNLGSREMAAARKGGAVGFGRAAGASADKLSSMAVDAAKRHLPLELYGRIDEVLFFAPLSRDEVASVAERMLDALGGALAERRIDLEVEGGVAEALLDAGGFDPELGARPLRRTLARLVEAPLAELILAGELPEGSVALVGVEGDRIVVDAVRRPAARAS